jgi:quinoprotein glucose dehydrogenase
MEERPVPQSTVPGEKSSPTQPFPIKPEPISRITLRHDELPKNITPSLTEYCEALWTKYKLSDAVPYNAWKMDQDIVQFPGAIGGGNWNGLSYNPALGLVFTNVTNAGQWGHIVDRTKTANAGGQGGQGGAGGLGRGPRGPGGAPGEGAGAEGAARQPGAPSGPAARADAEIPPAGRAARSPLAKVTPEGQRFWQADTRYSCAPPPWGELVAVNVNTGDIAWRSTLGQFDELMAKGLKTGAPNLGGGIATAGNLIFIGATVDGMFRAFDAKTGKELWSTKLTAPAHSIPATYLGKDGRQYVVVSAAGGGYLRDVTSDEIVAFAIPAAATRTRKK